MSTEAMRAERWWMIAAGAFMIVAATALLLWWNVEVAFVAATLGIVCWFLNLRNHLKKSIVEEIKEDEVFGEEDEAQ
ncbi:MAG TPA: hypothetical protein VEQ40_12260 [Pyrinomonadaceae bacterium]|nr:hypothetical protein [Pyrinomonadaceae bacterium]